MSNASLLRLGPRPAARPATVRWVAMGDSFSAGVNAGEMTWARIAARAVSTPARPVELFCLAQAGATTAEVAERQLEAAIEADPVLVSLICGANDVIGSVRPRPDEILAELDGLWASLRSALGARPMLTGTYPAQAPRSLGPRSRDRIERGLGQLNDGIRELAASHGVVCVELDGHPGEADPANFAEDGLHPSPVGHERAAATIAPAIDVLLSEGARA